MGGYVPVQGLPLWDGKTTTQRYAHGYVQTHLTHAIQSRVPLWTVAMQHFSDWVSWAPARVLTHTRHTHGPLPWEPAALPRPRMEQEADELCYWVQRCRLLGGTAVLFGFLPYRWTDVDTFIPPFVLSFLFCKLLKTEEGPGCVRTHFGNVGGDGHAIYSFFWFGCLFVCFLFLDPSHLMLNLTWQDLKSRRLMQVQQSSRCLHRLAYWGCVWRIVSVPGDNLQSRQVCYPHWWRTHTESIRLWL